MQVNVALLDVEGERVEGGDGRPSRAVDLGDPLEPHRRDRGRDGAGSERRQVGAASSGQRRGDRGVRGHQRAGAFRILGEP